MCLVIRTLSVSGFRMIPSKSSERTKLTRVARFTIWEYFTLSVLIAPIFALGLISGGQGQMTMETQQQAERQRINAEAAANVAKINADADAYAVKVRSEAEAEANKMIAESLTENLIRFNEVKNWDGKLPTYMAGEGSTTVPVLQMGTEQKTEQGE